MLLRYALFFLLIILLLCEVVTLNAQMQIKLYEDIGKNNAVDRPFFKTAVMFSSQFENNVIEFGNQWNISKPIQKYIPEVYMNYTRKFVWLKQAFDVQAFFLYNKFSEALFEINWGLLAGYSLKHFSFKLGTNFRTYGISDNSNTSHKLIHENFNMMYLFSYFVHQHKARWDMGVSITNIDYFTINQETNPIFNIKMLYAISPPFTVFLEGWYKSAGAFNLSVNPFGFFIRSGCVCDIYY